jgi:hypothetical protein
MLIEIGSNRSSLTRVQDSIVLHFHLLPGAVISKHHFSFTSSLHHSDAA